MIYCPHIPPATGPGSGKTEQKQGFSSGFLQTKQYLGQREWQRYHNSLNQDANSTLSDNPFSSDYDIIAQPGRAELTGMLTGQYRPVISARELQWERTNTSF